MSYNIRRPLSVAERNQFGNYSDTLAHLLFHRGIANAENAEKFLNPRYEAIHDPFLLKDAQKAAERVVAAIKNNEKIAIYADYDADGIPGAALWHDFFERIGFKNFTIYIPDRHDEGFGVNSLAVEELALLGAKLLITVDCGITDLIPIDLANRLGMTVIVTDHHEPPLEMPKAYAIVDHRQADCAYPDKNLCGSGVAFKLIQAVLKIDRFGLKDGQEKWLLDLVGIATLSDMVPLTGENRVLAHFGLTVLRKSPRKGLIALFQQLKMSQKNLTEDDIAFMVTPRINAASRMGKPIDAFNLLSASDLSAAETTALKLNDINSQRKYAVASLLKEIKQTIKARELIPRVIVLGNPMWRPSLLGLAANSCAEEFNRPVFLWGRDGDNAIKGSCRSEGKTHLVELMRAVPTGVFSQFGGHRFSGGFAVATDQVHYLEQSLNQAFVSQKISESPTIENQIDLELKLSDLSLDLHNDINRLAPFGVDNPKPVFLFKNVKPKAVRKFGKGMEHVEIVFPNIKAISFFGSGSHWSKGLKSDDKIDLLASLENSSYRGRSELRLRVVDVISHI